MTEPTKITARQLPKDFTMESVGVAGGRHTSFHFNCTITSTYEADAVVELIRIVYDLLSGIARINTCLAFGLNIPWSPYYRPVRMR